MKRIKALLVVAVLATSACTTTANEMPSTTTPDKEALYEAFAARVLDETGVEYEDTQEEWVLLVYHFCHFLDRFDSAEVMISESIASMITEGWSDAEVGYWTAVFEAEAEAATDLCPWQVSKLEAWVTPADNGGS